MTKKRVVVGMSGGVDSSVAAHLLCQSGYQVEGLFMKNWEEDDTEEYCSAAEDLKDAQQVCDTLGIPLHSVNFSAEYWDFVFEYFLEEYKAGRTPNPDIMCNKEIKFKAFLDYAKHLGADVIATGHYARRLTKDGKHYLLKGLDANKDQSYFLHALGQNALAHALFPLGELDKKEVRQLAKSLDFTNHEKKDSTGICFIGERKFKDFLLNYIPAQKGDIIDDEGNTIGQHDGLMFHTLGQRKGLGIGGLAEADEAPWYVVEKRLDTNQLVVGQGHNHPKLLRDNLEAAQCHWINEVADEFSCTAKIRYRQADVSCQVKQHNGKASVTFHEPQRAVTPGQSVVFYDGDICLGGGIIL